MTQIATVEQIIDAQMAVISVPRKSACGHDCEECAGCGVSGTAVKAKAINAIGAVPGQKVVVESSTQKLLGIVALVYLIPIILFVGSYVGGILLGFSEAVQTMMAVLGFFLGIVIAVLYDRHIRSKGGLSFTITRLF